MVKIKFSVFAAVVLLAITAHPSFAATRRNLGRWVYFACSSEDGSSRVQGARHVPSSVLRGGKKTSFGLRIPKLSIGENTFYFRAHAKLAVPQVGDSPTSGISDIAAIRLLAVKRAALFSGRRYTASYLQGAKIQSPTVEVLEGDSAIRLRPTSRTKRGTTSPRAPLYCDISRLPIS